MRNAVWAIIAIILIGGGLWWWMSAGNTTNTNVVVNENASSSAPITNEEPTASSSASGSSLPVSSTVTVTYNGTTFTPASVTIKEGDTVQFKNASGKDMWVASAMHPTHATYDSTTRVEHCVAGYTGATPFDQCAGGGDYSFAFLKVGTINYHDHLNPAAHGSVTVTQ